MAILEHIKGFGSLIASVYRLTGDVSAQVVTMVDTNGTPLGTTGTGTDRSGNATAASTTLIPANAARVRFFVRNDTATVVWINMGGTAVATAGGGNIAIAANGGNFDFAGYTGAVNIISAGGTVAVTAREF